MTEFREGDLVEAVKGETVIRGRVTDVFLGLSGRLVHTLESEGFTLTLIDRPKPKVVLPTEPGCYLDVEGDVWQLPNGGVSDLSEDYAPYTRLEPVPVTARKVLERIEEVYGEDYFSNIDASWNAVAAEFGVTDE